MFVTKMELPVGITTLHLSRKNLYLLLLAAFLIGFGGYSYVQQGQAVDAAVTIQATVNSAQVERIDSRRSIDYEPEFEYTYRYRGTTYTSEQVFPGPTIRTYSDRSQAQSIVRSYEPRTTVQAYVRPSAPGDEFLIRERTLWLVRVLARIAKEYPGSTLPVTDALFEYVETADGSTGPSALTALGHVSKGYPHVIEAAISTLLDLLDADSFYIRANSAGLLADLSGEYPGELRSLSRGWWFL
jgi:hypothetical protein